ncbi:RNase J family beta-CASP ribonuclease [Candidatus Woesearchaeota archaeon]|nr:RNase J family beta-CASP ribonuclease [Candidatus Woesearchaeota archaeon]
MIKIAAVGGYSEVGKNMTAIQIDNDVIILDMGIYLPKLLDFEEGHNSRKNLGREELIHLGVIPNDDFIRSWRDKVKAIVVGHCHLDHSSGVIYLEKNYSCPIIGTPFTNAVIRTLAKNENIQLKNYLQDLEMGNKISITKNIEIEFVNTTHSTPQSAMVAIHTNYGTIMYCNDFKLDETPVIGKKPDYNRLREIGNGNVRLAIIDCLYVNENTKTPSEMMARQMLKEVIFENDIQGTLIGTTFASNISRLKSFLDFGLKINRQVVFLGRSMEKYISCAENLDIVNFSQNSEIVKYRDDVKKKLKEISKNKDKYLIVTTGNQGEPGSILVDMANDKLPLKLDNKDSVIFSCNTIPAPNNIKNRKLLEKALDLKSINVFMNIHQSGHGARKDIEELIQILKPEKLIPGHGDPSRFSKMNILAKDLGLERKNIHILENKQKLELN